MLSLDDWDKQVSPILRDIEVDSYYAMHYANKVLMSVGILPIAPTFLSRAEHDLTLALHRLEGAAQVLRQAKEQFSQKPKDE